MVDVVGKNRGGATNAISLVRSGRVCPAAGVQSLRPGRHSGRQIGPPENFASDRRRNPSRSEQQLVRGGACPCSDWVNIALGSTWPSFTRFPQTPSLALSRGPECPTPFARVVRSGQVLLGTIRARRARPRRTRSGARGPPASAGSGVRGRRPRLKDAADSERDQCWAARSPKSFRTCLEPIELRHAGETRASRARHVPPSSRDQRWRWRATPASRPGFCTTTDPGIRSRRRTRRQSP